MASQKCWMGRLMSDASDSTEREKRLGPFQVGGVTWIVSGSCFAAIGGTCRCDLRHSKGQGAALSSMTRIPTRKDKGATLMELPTLPTIENSIHDQAHTCG